MGKKRKLVRAWWQQTRVLAVTCGSLALLAGGCAWRQYVLSRARIPQPVAVATWDESVSGASVWSAAFQLAWNTLVDERVGFWVEMWPSEPLVESLNNSDFSVAIMPNDGWQAWASVADGWDQAAWEASVAAVVGQAVIGPPAVVSEGDARVHQFAVAAAQRLQPRLLVATQDMGWHAFGRATLPYLGQAAGHEPVATSEAQVWYENKRGYGLRLTADDETELIVATRPKGASLAAMWQQVTADHEAYTGRVTLGSDDSWRLPRWQTVASGWYEAVLGKSCPLYRSPGGEGVLVAAGQTVAVGWQANETDSTRQTGVTGQRLIVREPGRSFIFDSDIVIFFRRIEQKQPFAAWLMVAP